MDHFAGLDVSLKETAACIVDAAGQLVAERKVASEPGAVAVQASKGFGFIAPLDGGHDVFVHHRRLSNPGSGNSTRTTLSASTSKKTAARARSRPPTSV